MTLLISSEPHWKKLLQHTPLPSTALNAQGGLGVYSDRPQHKPAAAPSLTCMYFRVRRASLFSFV